MAMYGITVSWRKMRAIALPLLLTAVLFLVILILSTRVQAKELVVDEKGTGDYFTVMDALCHVEEGDTILVKEGNYSADFLWTSLKDNISLIGEDRETTRFEFIYGLSFIVKNSFVTFSEINFSAMEEGYTIISPYNGTGITFRNCTFHNISEVMICHTCDNCTLENN
ncbi:MAG: hypothetical protein KAU14_07940, partial [Thermoplasmata archaeon]|nr:hypothetical protein [Thermoplasmata archaeon]